MMTTSNSTNIIELLKYPILVFSIVVALVVLKATLGLQFGMVTEISTDGMKFSEESNEATLESLTELEAKLQESAVRIAALEKAINKDKRIDLSTQSKAFSESQTVSDATAKLANLKPKNEGHGSERVKGYMWIGNYQDKWKNTKLAKIETGQPITIAPSYMRIGTQYQVLGNMVIRDGKPPNDDEYYRARKSLGVVQRGNIVRLLKKPEEIKREFAVQYWAEVEYVRAQT